MRVVLVSFFLTVLALVASSSALAVATPVNQPAAYGACQADLAAQVSAGGDRTGYYCKLNPLAAGGNTSCASGMGAGYYIQWKDGVGGLNSFYWCVPADCSTYNSGYPSQTWSSSNNDGDVRCSDGCMSVWHTLPGSIGICYSDGVTCAQQGWYTGNGTRCTASTDASFSKSVQGAMLCDHGSASCYNSEKGFCASTEYGEQICEKAPVNGAGGCAAGATGATCVGNNTPPPPPPDPPVPGGKPPDSSGTATGKDAGGNTYNYTTNNYSGTSPGPGSSAPATGSSAGSPGGTGSNTNGSGNSGSKGTDSNGNCPDGKKPTASGCSGTYRDNGCDTPPACFGDAVLCGIAANTHKAACNPASGSTAPNPFEGAPSSGSLSLPSSGDPTDASGDPTSSSVSNEVDLGDTTSLNAAGFGYSSACPLTDGIHFDFLGKSISVDTSTMCTPLSFIYYIVMAFAYFTAAKIIAGVK